MGGTFYLLQNVAQSTQQIKAPNGYISTVVSVFHISNGGQDLPADVATCTDFCAQKPPNYFFFFFTVTFHPKMFTNTKAVHGQNEFYCLAALCL